MTTDGTMRGRVEAWLRAEEIGLGLSSWVAETATPRRGAIAVRPPLATAIVRRAQAQRNPVHACQATETTIRLRKQSSTPTMTRHAFSFPKK